VHVIKLFSNGFDLSWQ